MNNIMQLLDAEIAQVAKTTKPVHVRLKHMGNGVYKGFLPFKIEGDFILNSKKLDNVPVLVDYQEDHVVIELDSNEENINAFLSKDEASLLKAVKEQVRGELKEKPSFVIGPPGTGKTKVITKILEEAIKNNLKVLVASPTNMAVENVFERIDAKAIGLKDGEVILTIKTELEDLQEFSPEAIKRRKLQPIEDELEILQMAKADMVKRKRDAQPTLEAQKNLKEAADTKLANFQRDFRELSKRQKELKSSIDETNNRIKSLTGNAFLKGVAKVFMGNKLEELEEEREKKEKKLKTVQNEIDALESKIQVAQTETEEAKKSFTKEHDAIYEATVAIDKINKRIKHLQEKAEELRQLNLYSSAKIVGATLVNATLNQKLQNAEFDLIIVDEASMALTPYITIAAQALREKAKGIKKISYIKSDDLYEAQNKAVSMALNSRLVLVGDPKQLPPIAETREMKKTIFEVYGADRIFEGENPENTVLLDINFRNHPKITALASKLFYGGLLKSGKEDDGKDALFVRKSNSKMVSSDGSYINNINMKIVVSQVEKALKRGRRSVGIITPYRKQALLIEENLQYLFKEYPDADVQAGTVHKFQGKEKDIIIYDLTFSPSEDGRIPATYDGDKNSTAAKLLNVAMTRAEGFFIIVGDVEGILKLKNQNLVLREWVEAIAQ
ncbi:DEAD/DEAH box helicase [Sulfurimonas indica]|uniref:DEAD/DEAH box helicase n=1 Tax=Sulfurimonas TaxID=202746 RepID=UPI0012651CDD|nr:AAA domain-containing protein [Sulfurimonas indica]